MAALSYDPKDPDDIDDFTIDWSKVLTTGETISTAVAVVVAGDVAVLGDVGIAGALTTVRLAGGTLAAAAEVRVRITTSAGRQLDQTMWFRVEEN